MSFEVKAYAGAESWGKYKICVAGSYCGCDGYIDEILEAGRSVNAKRGLT